MTVEEYQRERNRLKQVRYRKRERAKSEGKSPDTYITNDDYIEWEDERAPDLDSASEQETSEQDTSPLWVKLLRGAAFIGMIVFVAIAEGNKKS
jgi:hypothetical protein